MLVGCGWVACHASICRLLQPRDVQVSVGYEYVEQLITQRLLVQIQPPPPKSPQDFTVLGASLSMTPALANVSPQKLPGNLWPATGESQMSATAAGNPLPAHGLLGESHGLSAFICPGIAACPSSSSPRSSALWHSEHGMHVLLLHSSEPVR